MVNGDKELIVGILVWIIIIIIFGLMIYWTILQWHLCRNEGLSFLYCVQHIL